MNEWNIPCFNLLGFNFFFSFTDRKRINFSVSTILSTHTFFLKQKKKLTDCIISRAIQEYRIKLKNEISN